MYGDNAYDALQELYDAVHNHCGGNWQRDLIDESYGPMPLWYAMTNAKEILEGNY